jgi:hypothetical protein
MTINYQQHMNVYRPGNGFESGQCKKDKEGNYATLANEEFRGKVPRFLHTSQRYDSKPKKQMTETENRLSARPPK